MRTPGELTDLFQANGLKVTPQRQAVFRALLDDHSHPTADAVHAAVTVDLPNVSLRTVYQVLHDLTRLGEIHALDLGTGAARFDPNVEAHQHLVCVACGKVRDIYVEPVAAPADPGFTVDRAEVVFRGRCAECQSLTESQQPKESHRA